jgi:hypothetical protein
LRAPLDRCFVRQPCSSAIFSRRPNNSERNQKQRDDEPKVSCSNESGFNSVYRLQFKAIVVPGIGKLDRNAGFIHWIGEHLGTDVTSRRRQSARAHVAGLKKGNDRNQQKRDRKKPLPVVNVRPERREDTKDRASGCNSACGLLFKSPNAGQFIIDEILIYFEQEFLQATTSPP